MSKRLSDRLAGLAARAAALGLRGDPRPGESALSESDLPFLARLVEPARSLAWSHVYAPLWVASAASSLRPYRAGEAPFDEDEDRRRVAAAADADLVRLDGLLRTGDAEAAGDWLERRRREIEMITDCPPVALGVEKRNLLLVLQGVEPPRDWEAEWDRDRVGYRHVGEAS